VQFTEFIIVIYLVIGALWFVDFIGSRLGFRVILIGVLVAHIALSFTLYFLHGLTFDARNYDQTASEFAYAVQFGESTGNDFPLRKAGWPVLLSVVYLTFGHFPLIGLLINAIFITLAVAVVGWTAKDVTNLKTSKYAAVIFALFPASLYWPSLLGREAVVLLLLSLILRAMAWIISGRHRAGWSLLVAATLLLVPFRLEMAVAAGVFSSITCAVYLIARIMSRKLRLVGMALALSLATFSIFLANDIYLAIENYLRATRSDLQVGANLPINLPTSTPNNILEFMLLRFADLGQVSLGPTFTSWSGTPLMLRVDSISWSLLIGFAIVGLFLAYNRLRILLLTSPALLLLSVNITIMGNWGTVIRLRLMAVPFLCIAAAIGFSFAHRTVIQVARKHLERTPSARLWVGQGSVGTTPSPRASSPR